MSTDDRPLLSICIPNYEMARWLGDAVRSALAQEPADQVEVVVVDNASTDESRDVLASFDGEPRLRVVLADEHVPMAENWNRAVAAARGEWCVVLSADDILLPEFTPSIAAELAVPSSVAVASGAAVMAGTPPRQQLVQRPSLTGQVPSTALLAELVVRNSLCLSAVAFRRSAWERIGGFRPAAGVLADWDLWLRLFAPSGSTAAVVDVVGAQYFTDRGARWQELCDSGEAVGAQAAWARSLPDSGLPLHLISAVRSQLARRTVQSAVVLAAQERLDAARACLAQGVAEGAGWPRARAAAEWAVLGLPGGALIARARLRAGVGARIRGALPWARADREQSGPGRRRLLFVSHQASRTGAPLIALDVLSALDPARFTRVVVLKEGGPLVDEFRAVADEFLWPGRWILPTAVRLKLLKFPRLLALVEQALATYVVWRTRPDVVYANTVVSADYARAASRLGIPSLLHCHELEPVASRFLRRHRVTGRDPRCELVACSTAVRDNLIGMLGVPEGQVRVVYEPVDVEAVRSRANSERLAMDGHVPTVVACGSLEPRKGPDLWLEVAVRVAEASGRPFPRFRWIGTGAMAADLSERAARLGDRSDVRFVGEQENPFPAMAAAEVVVVPSLVDPFPRVTLEAMALGKPVVAFDAGGLPEQLGDAGILVPAGDTDAMADAVLRLLADAGLRQDLGARAVARVRSHFELSQVVGSLNSLLIEATARGTSVAA